MTMTAEHHFQAGALENVFLINGFSVTKGSYGEAIQYEDIPGLYKAIVNAVLFSPASLTGKEVSFLRDRLDMFQHELGDILGVEEQTVSLWERNAHFIPKACDVLLRKLCIENFKQSIQKDIKNLSISELSRHIQFQRKLQYIASYSNNEWKVAYRSEIAQFEAKKDAIKDTIFIMAYASVQPANLAKVGAWQEFLETSANEFEPISRYKSAVGMKTNRTCTISLGESQFQEEGILDLPTNLKYMENYYAQSEALN